VAETAETDDSLSILFSQDLRDWQIPVFRGFDAKYSSFCVCRTLSPTRFNARGSEIPDDDVSGTATNPQTCTKPQNSNSFESVGSDLRGRSTRLRIAGTQPVSPFRFQFFAIKILDCSVTEFGGH
jgi:hypothetical protein